MAMSLRMSSSYDRIYEVVRRIPFGRVATYGQVAALAGFPRRARLAGYALHALPPGKRIPWHRVVNARGEISARAELHYEKVQRALLEAEGIVFDSMNRVPLSRYQWRPALRRATVLR